MVRSLTLTLTFSLVFAVGAMLPRSAQAAPIELGALESAAASQEFASLVYSGGAELATTTQDLGSLAGILGLLSMGSGGDVDLTALLGGWGGSGDQLGGILSWLWWWTRPRTSVSEPGTLLLVGLGLMGAARFAQRRAKPARQQA